MHFRKRAFVLLEVIISLGLAMGLLAAALYFYRFATLADAEMKKVEEKAFKSRLLQSRLTHLFSSLQGQYFFTMPEEKGLSIGQSLVFNYNSDARIQYFHGKVMARILVDKDRRFLLAVWQDNKLKDKNVPPPMHLEVLAENIDDIRFEFLVGEDSSNEIQLPGVFVPEWPKSKDLPNDIPRAVKIKVWQNGQSIEWAFPIPCK